MRYDIPKKYYLETNSIYSLINYLDLIVDSVDVATSLFAYDELISGISEKTYHKRKVMLSKMKKSKLKIYPYLPMECIAISFGLDISECQLIKEKKVLLWEQVNLAISSKDYSEYILRLQEKSVDLLETQKTARTYKKESINILNSIISENNSDIKRIEERQKEKPEYYTINMEDLFYDEDQKPCYEREKKMLAQVLKSCNIYYEDAELEEIVLKYDGHQLVAFILGEMLYMWEHSHDIMKQSGRNDIADLQHLLYLKDENYVIVSEDKLFSYSSMKQMRIGCNEFLTMFK